MMRTRDTFFSREHLYSLGIDEESGRHYLSIPVSSNVADYEEFYGLSSDEFEAFSHDAERALAFVASARAREADERLLVQPGWNRGVPRLPPPPGTPPWTGGGAPSERPVEDARSRRAVRPPLGAWFGAPDSEADVYGSRSEAAAIPAPDARIEAVAARARAGDLTGRAELVDVLDDADASLETRLSAQRLLVLIARDEDFAEPTTFRYADHVDDDDSLLREELAGLGKLMLARSAIDVLVRIGRAHWDDTDVRRAVTPSLLVLVGRSETERREAPTLVSLAQSAHRILEEESAAYLLQGEPWSPARIVARMRDGAIRRHASKEAFSNWFLAGDLAAWSGIPGPYLKDVVLTDDDLAAVVAWADALDALPWVPGRKYFHGHDVDGGPSLR